MTLITADRVRELFAYDPETGALTRKVRSARSPDNAGAVVGCKYNNGYLHVRVEGVRYSVHRLIWLHVTGAFPAEIIDHINGVRWDNRLCNLRSVTQSMNIQNLKRATPRNKTGLLGVCVSRNKFKAAIKFNGKNHTIGYFSDPQEAHAAYLEVKRKVHPACVI